MVCQTEGETHTVASLEEPFLRAGSLAERYQNLNLRTKFALHIALSVILLFALLRRE